MRLLPKLLAPLLLGAACFMPALGAPTDAALGKTITTLAEQSGTTIPKECIKAVLEFIADDDVNKCIPLIDIAADIAANITDPLAILGSIAPDVPSLCQAHCTPDAIAAKVKPVATACQAVLDAKKITVDMVVSFVTQVYPDYRLFMCFPTPDTKGLCLLQTLGALKQYIGQPPAKIPKEVICTHCNAVLLTAVGDGLITAEQIFGPAILQAGGGGGSMGDVSKLIKSCAPM